jgi:predicted nucleotidyltransferase
LNSHYKEMLQCLLKEKADFIIIGAYAMSAHGYPRATGDIDIWVSPDEANSKKTYNALARFGAPVNEIEAKDFATEDVVYQIGVAPWRIDIITAIDGVTYEEADKDKKYVELGGMKLPVLSLDKLIKNKMSTGREKDKLDVKTLKNRKKPL